MVRKDEADAWITKKQWQDEARASERANIAAVIRTMNSRLDNAVMMPEQGSAERDSERRAYYFARYSESVSSTS